MTSRKSYTFLDPMSHVTVPSTQSISTNITFWTNSLPLHSLTSFVDGPLWYSSGWWCDDVMIPQVSVRLMYSLFQFLPVCKSASQQPCNCLTCGFGLSFCQWGHFEGKQCWPGCAKLGCVLQQWIILQQVKGYVGKSEMGADLSVDRSIDMPLSTLIFFWYVSFRWSSTSLFRASSLGGLGTWGNGIGYDWITAICFEIEALVLLSPPDVVLTQSECIFNVDCFVCASVSPSCWYLSKNICDAEQGKINSLGQE